MVLNSLDIYSYDTLPQTPPGDKGFINGSDGNDYIDLSETSRENYHLFLGDGDDRVIGSDGDDFLSGGSGNDTIDGAAGIDTLIFKGSNVEYFISASARFFIKNTI